ncbi:PaaI family thioesterase [Bosea vestrisii]|uniref:PaaI family thioesterase n=1 Tax=Bosea vestrisii TaxID=151416 RepID=UPI0024DFB91B|nr:PaaI family thioesterase [Bosea vestrisii]WID96091.1 PaaI family thioesterase [Bosea vestrisii]
MTDPALVARIEASFSKQAFMATLGARLVRVAPGEVEITMPVSAHLCQQHGFVHAGAVSTIADSAAGYAALTTMPAGNGVLTAEFKINLLAPATGDELVAKGKVVKAGRTLTLAMAEVFAVTAGKAKLCAMLTATCMAIAAREGVSD